MAISSVAALIVEVVSKNQGLWYLVFYERLKCMYSLGEVPSSHRRLVLAAAGRSGDQWN